jgi:crotonobetainyl-CoA:carnitine CoA-transferase CaiB-like acyl-CoA transferase
MTTRSDDAPRGPLVGYRVLELCSTIAGPVCARLLADFGAEVIKVEPPEGDPVRSMGYLDGDVSLYTPTILRNKRVATVDLKTAEGCGLVRRLAAKCDVVVENFRPGTLERLGLGYDVLAEDNPSVVLVRISGYGQTGPYSPKPGYGAICEAFAGVRHLTGDPDRPPARVALALTDYFTAVYAAFGAVMALLERERTGKGQIVDAALYEAAFTMMEAVVPAYDRLKIVPTRQGSRLPSMAPNNLYPARDGAYLLIAANNDQIYRRLVEAIGKPHLAADPRFATIRSRSANADAIDAEIAEWTARTDGKEAERILELAAVPVSRVYTIADIFQDPHFRARDMLLQVAHDKLGQLTMPGIVPKLSRTPGAVYRAGPEQGEDTHSVLRDLLGIPQADLDTLEHAGVIRGKPAHRARPGGRAAADAT